MFERIHLLKDLFSAIPQFLTSRLGLDQYYAVLANFTLASLSQHVSTMNSNKKVGPQQHFKAALGQLAGMD